MASQRRILVADRNIKFLEQARGVLSQIGVGIQTAERGNQALASFESQRPDGALLNIDLPEVSGADVCAEAKQIDPSVPVVLMNVGELPQFAVLAQQCGADNYVIRPMKVPQLHFCVRAMLRLRPLLRRTASADLLDQPGQRLSMVSAEMFQRFLGLEVRRANRYGFPLSVLAIRVDPLPKNITRAWAQVLEEQLRPALSTAIRSCVREIDLSTTPDLENTLVLMPHTDIEGARIVAERIRSQVGSQPYHFGRTRIQPTVSLGVAVTHGDRTAPHDLLALCEARRDQATNAGCNQVCFR